MQSLPIYLETHVFLLLYEHYKRACAGLIICMSPSHIFNIGNTIYKQDNLRMTKHLEIIIKRFTQKDQTLGICDVVYWQAYLIYGYTSILSSFHTNIACFVTIILF